MARLTACSACTTLVPWDAEAARDRLQQFVIERFGEAEAIGVLDETGIPKKGPHSAGVHKQYCGALGKIENCQVATLLTYATPRGHVFLDRRLFLSEEWCWDRARRARAKIPPEVTFQSKPEQARAMLEHAWEQGVPMRWVTGDSVYGDSPALRAAIEAHGCWYVLALTSVVRCWLNPPPLEGPKAQTGGRPRRAIRLAPHAPKARTVAEVMARLPREQWKRLSVGTGTKGPRIYDWARVRVIESRDGFPGPEVWLLARRSVSDPTELTYYFALAPKTVTLQQLATVAGTRYTVEQAIKEAKAARWGPIAMRCALGTAGIATSRSRCWRRSGSPTSGWWQEKKTGLEDLSVPEVRRLLEVALPLPERGVRERLAWSYWRRRKCYRARVCHYRHRSWPKYAGPNPLDSS